MKVTKRVLMKKEPACRTGGQDARNSKQVLITEFLVFIGGVSNCELNLPVGRQVTERTSVRRNWVDSSNKLG